MTPEERNKYIADCFHGFKRQLLDRADRIPSAWDCEIQQWIMDTARECTVKFEQFNEFIFIGATLFLGACLIGRCTSTHRTEQKPDKVDSVVHALVIALSCREVNMNTRFFTESEVAEHTRINLGTLA